MPIRALLGVCCHPLRPAHTRPSIHRSREPPGPVRESSFIIQPILPCSLSPDFTPFLQLCLFLHLVSTLLACLPASLISRRFIHDLIRDHFSICFTLIHSRRPPLTALNNPQHGEEGQVLVRVLQGRCPAHRWRLQLLQRPLLQLPPPARGPQVPEPRRRK
jgi:hypothetical protein